MVTPEISAVSLEDYTKLFTTTATATKLTSVPTSSSDHSDDKKSMAYYAKLAPVTENTSCELYLDVKNVRTGGYSGFVFAADANGKPYYVYGALNNGRDNDKGNCELRPKYGTHSDTTLSTTWYKADQALTAEGCGQYKVVYEGYTATVYTKLSASADTWTQVSFGSMESFTLVEGSYVAIGAFNRAGLPASARTADISNASFAIISAPTSFIVKYDPNGGTGTMESTEVDGNVLKLPECTFTAPIHKTFRGWSTSPDGEIIRHHEYTIDGDTTLYAIWKDIKYSITFDSNNGSGMLDEFSAVAGELTLIEYTMSIPVGKVFKGWLLTPDGEIITTETVNITELIIPAEVTLDLNGHTVTADYLVSFGDIIDTASNGLLVAELFELTENSYLPIFDSAANGYRFFAYQLKNLGVRAVADKTTFGFALLFEDTAAYELLANSEDTDVGVEMTLAWGENAQTFAFSSKLIRQYAALQVKYPALRAAMMLGVTGLDALESGAVLTVTPAASAMDTQIVTASEAMTYTVAE